MPDRPAGAELLAEVRRTLLHEIVPRLEGMPRFHALMAANALQIVMRELDAGETLAASEQAASALADGAADAAAGALVGALRSGRFDGDPACHRTLLCAVATRVAVWKPERLNPDERELVDAP